MNQEKWTIQIPFFFVLHDEVTNPLPPTDPDLLISNIHAYRDILHLSSDDLDINYLIVDS